MAAVTIAGRELGAAIFDTDGVVTDTARVHFTAWKDVFDAVLRERSGTGTFDEFTRDDYLRYVDGVPRYDGVRRFLASRDIDLGYGDPADGPEQESVCGVGNRKNEHFLRRLREDGAPAYDGTVSLLRWLRRHEVPLAVISASRNAGEVLAAAGVDELFDTMVDGREAERLGLPGKPDPAVFLEAARRLAVAPAQAMVAEDAQAGVRAARAGGFGLVVGVDRDGQRQQLLAEGADVVVDDLAELLGGATTTS
jgi:beta-phosphoglucomutase family hydrolase